IVNIETTVQAVSEAAREAELMSGLVVDEALVNVTGRHLKGDNSRGVVAITNRDRVVKEDDVLRVIEGAQNVRIPADQEIIHVLSREFTVDDQTGVKDPVGMTGVRLEAEVHIVTASTSALSNLTKVVGAAGIRVSDCVMSSLAASEAVLDQGEKDLGVALIDIGGGISDIVVFVEGGVAFSGVVHVTQDLSIGLKIPIENAESVKKTYGNARVALVDPTEKVEISGVAGRPSKWVLRQDIASVIEPRMREILEMIDQELVKSGRKKLLSGGIVLTGGGSLLDGTHQLAEEVFGLPVSSGDASGLSGFTDRAHGAEFATSIGLLRYGQRYGTGHASQSTREEGGVWRRVKHWISENL
ncbi:MAG: cell division protein FtsA, partial [Spirochaetia bacterium]|nr:cell division protein FtsA [Spirochaetia bacterium]